MIRSIAIVITLIGTVLSVIMWYYLVPETALQIELLYYHFAGPSTWGGQTECTTDLVQPRLCEVLTGKRSNFLSTASISNIFYRQ